MASTAFPLPTGGFPSLHPDRVQLWRVRLNQDQTLTERVIGLLSAEEIARANRFHFPHLRTHYISARSALRLLLSELTGIPNYKLRFAYTQHEKPYLPNSDLKFNLSHANQVALLAFAPGREVGVDVEYVRDSIDTEQIARRFFAPAEVADFLSVPGAGRQQAFYNGWTRKEAYIKAIGNGLTYPLDSFRVSLIPGEPARLIEVATDPDEAARWKMTAVYPGEGYTGALIAEGQDWTLETWAFDFQGGRNEAI